MAKKTKILFVITQGHWGGAQRYVFDVATHLGPEFEPIVAIGERSGSTELAKRLAEAGVRVIPLRHLSRSISPWNDLCALLELATLYRREEPNVIHLNSSKAGIVGSLARLCVRLRKANFKIVYTAHGWVFDEPLGAVRKTLYRILEKYTARYKDAIVVISEHDQKRGQALGIADSKLKLIRNQIETPVTTKHTLAELGATPLPQQLVFGTVANFYKTKGVDVLVSAIATVRNELANVLFVVIGDGSDRHYIETLIGALHLQKQVILAGEKRNAIDYLPLFDALVLPSRKEGLPYALLEAIAMKVPVIATRVGGIPELIEDKKSGLLVNPDSVTALASALVFAATHPDELATYATQGTAATHFSGMIEATTSLYLSLAQR